MSRAALTATVMVLIAARSGAYTFPVVNQNGTFVHPHWPAKALPIVMQINDQTGPDLANISHDSDPMGALTRALSHWPAVCGIRFQQGSTAIASGGNDGVNLISFAATPENQQALEMAGNPVGLTLVFFHDDEITETDVLFNSLAQFTTTLNSDAELEATQPPLQDVEGVATHELGHVIGLHHSGVESAVMWPIASVLDREPDADDIAGARSLYPIDTPGGTIRGTVTVDGRPAFGAQVVALNGDGAVSASALTLPTGAYAIESLPPDTYSLYVEPLDGPQSASADGSCVRLGNLNGAGIYDGATLTTDFATTFAGSSGTPSSFVLEAGGTLQIDFAVAGGSADTNPTVIGPATVDGAQVSAHVSSHALAVRPGTDQWIALGGPNLDEVSGGDISFSSAGISVDAGSLVHLSATCGGAPLPLLVFRTTIASDAPAGGSSVLITRGSQVAAMSGAVRIAAAPTCDGDCSGDGQVTVDELLTLVNIALGNTSVAACPAGDANGNGSVTVDEILTAVNNALNGCDVTP